MEKLVTVVEIPNFSSRAKGLLSPALREEIAVLVAEDPTYGDLMVGTGGCRKGRFALEGRGKSGSVRFVYLYCGDGKPIFLVALFAKNEKSNLTKSERNNLAKVAKAICKTYGARK
ncbi:MAG: type II toxin-antitoxin system RelE/ParE family toxin [Rhodospirillaceae bacterium]|jgi:hypothetical protein|nr:type II toxin-antitoxin system RelE/ParE family toxin [Rhodospirillales bacterium]MBT3905614.1 type II toxin-antitoxin system RelE/ParE family toxin [Rhodospirillaceae bacterium]MBT4703178.1 type II toxin-antitoxin system RelE/ParE family toxin [Rhodospirillaceae bacterium]MBT5034901.1 type II toxin-antitoxin system RelE/ParE family toxin [Rhodospirillaceae bacterium]MBT6221670.1 type II toxin-antitoxin system RelE/ParE family toxin [Rhodospirillaceae bacterium]